MRSRFNIISVLVVVVLLSSFVAASMMIPANDKAKENAQAPEKSPAIGENWDLERVDFIHYAKPDKTGKPDKGPKQESCYKLLGVKWKSLPVSYSINPANSDGLSEQFIVSAVSTSAETWDDATSSELLNDAYTIDYSAEYGVQNYENAIVFGDYPSDSAIAVTSIWFTRRGKRIVEFDMIFNTRFTWGDGELNPAVMDLQNIATHELGHGVGLDDIYSTACADVTMYGYSSYGDLDKRTLEQSDIMGLQSMYAI